MNKKQTMYAAIEAHGNNLNTLFNTGLDPMTLCKKLRRLECKAYNIALHWCNGTGGVNSDNIDTLTAPIIKQVKKILGESAPVQFNGDARGYALKLSDTWVRENNARIYPDWGGYGILAPDFSN